MLQSLFFVEVIIGRTDAISALLSRGADINGFDNRGYTALHWATELQNEKVVSFLIAAGADVNRFIKTDVDFSFGALDIALSSRNLKIAKILKDAGADLNIPNPRGTFALHSACANKDVGLIKLLLSHGANIHAKDSLQNTALHTSVTENQGNSHFAVFETLLANGADPNAKNIEGMTALFLLASTICSTEIIDLFAKYNADFNLKDYREATPLLAAIFYQDIKMHRNIILGKSNKPSEDSSLIFKQSVQVIKSLIKHGANPNEELAGYLPLKHALGMCIKYHKTYNYKEEDEIDLVNVLMEQGDVNTVDSDGRSILAMKLPEHLWQTIVKHVANLKAQDKSIHKNLYKIILDTPKYKTYFKQCIKDLRRV